METYVSRDVRRVPDGWRATVVFGDRGNYPATIREYIYATREQARQGDISDGIGSRGRIA